MKLLSERDPVHLSVILLAGGAGTRMHSAIPKQYHPLNGKLVVLHSLEVFLSIPEVDEIVIVCDLEYESSFSPIFSNKNICFARPGIRRQDSVFSGLQTLNADVNQLVCIHDSARPVINANIVKSVAKAAEISHAAVVGVPIKSTIKVCDHNQFVTSTPDRASLWEVQTPQIIRKNLLEEAFDHVHAKNLSVTDDVSMVELLGKPVQMVEGCYSNIKITTPEDMILIQELIKKNDLLQAYNCL